MEPIEPEQIINQTDLMSIRKMLIGSGYSEKAIEYYINKPHMGDLPDADQVTELTGTCGDTMKIFLMVDRDIIKDIKYQVLGCPGAVASAMVAADLAKGRSLEYAGTISDNDIFNTLTDMPDKKHHCIQLAVKTLHKALEAWKNGKHV